MARTERHESPHTGPPTQEDLATLGAYARRLAGRGRLVGCDAEDVAQEVALRWYERRSDVGGAFLPWAKRVATNLVFDGWRRETGIDAIEIDRQGMVALDADPARLSERRDEMTTAIRAALRVLPPAARPLFIEECRRRLGLPESCRADAGTGAAWRRRLVRQALARLARGLGGGGG
jgi:hypothetical protein